MDNKKWCCDECDWIGPEGKLLIAPNPYLPGGAVTFCPQCKQAEQFTLICEVDGCEWPVTCGTPTKSGRYWQTCHEHVPPRD